MSTGATKALFPLQAEMALPLRENLNLRSALVYLAVRTAAGGDKLEIG
jgi:hypothetical protein